MIYAWREVCLKTTSIVSNSTLIDIETKPNCQVFQAFLSPLTNLPITDNYTVIVNYLCERYTFDAELNLNTSAEEVTH